MVSDVSVVKCVHDGVTRLRRHAAVVLGDLEIRRRGDRRQCWIGGAADIRIVGQHRRKIRTGNNTLVGYEVDASRQHRPVDLCKEGDRDTFAGGQGSDADGGTDKGGSRNTAGNGVRSLARKWQTALACCEVSR